MPDADKLRFLTGKYEDLANKAVTRGQVYFAIDGNDGKIVFDAPITATTTQRIIMSNKVDFANQAQSDSAGNEFISKYPYSFTTTSTGTSFQINIFAQNGDQISSSPITVPVASSTAAGIITNAAQDITGTKTFKTGLVVDASSGFNYSGIESGTSNSARPVWFAYAGTNGKPVYNTNFTYNPSTKTLKADKLDGLAAKATADGAGNIFISKYPYTLALDSEQTSIIIKAQNSDTLFTLSPRFLPLNGGHITGSLLVDDLTAGELVVNGVARIIDNLYANLTGNVTGNLIGNVTGNLTGLASQAAADSAGNNFIATYPYAFSQNTAKTNLIIKTPDGSDFGTYTFNFLPLTGGTLTGDLIIKKTTSDTNAYAGTGPQIVFQNSNASQNIKLLFSDYDTIQSPASLTLVGNQGGEYFIAPNIKATSKFYGNLEGNADTATLAATASVAKLIENTLFIGSEKSFTGAADVYIGETLYYVVGSESDTAGTWTGTNSAITSYYEGLTVIYVPKKAGASTTTLNINGLGAKTCYYTNTNKLTTHYAVNTPIILTYYNNGWRRADYDSNTNTQVRIYKDESGTFPIIASKTAAANITSGSTNVYGEISATNEITMTPSSGTITATNFSGLATQAQKDSFGNEFISTYPFSITLDSTNTKFVIKKANNDAYATLEPAFVKRAGDTMTGLLKLKANQYYAENNVSGLDAQNSDLIGVNGIYLADQTDACTEGLHFVNGSNWNTLWTSGNLLKYTYGHTTAGVNGTTYNIIKAQSARGSEFQPVYIDGNGDVQLVTSFQGKVILGSKTFTGILASENNQANGTFYFGNIKPTNYYNVWKIRYRVKVIIPNTSVSNYNNYSGYFDVEVWGSRSTYLGYKIFNNHYSTSYRSLYYHVIYTAKEAGYSTYGHVFGVGLRSSNNPTTANFERTITVDVLEAENCTFEFFNTATKYASIPGTGSINYNGIIELNGYSNGLQENGDSDSYYLLRYQAAILNDAEAIASGNIIVANSANKYHHLKKGTSFEINYPILYAGSNIAANATGTNNYFVQQFNITTTQSGTYTAYKPVYIKGTLSGTTFTPISTTPLTQTIPESADGYHYILLGTMYSTTGLYLQPEHPIFAFMNGKFGVYAEAASYALTANNANNATNANITRYIKSVDTRNTAINPQDMRASEAVSFDFKAKATIGLNDANYSGVMNFRPYASGSDWSGGPAHQLAFNDAGLYRRKSIGDNTWGDWYKILDSGNYTSYTVKKDGTGASGTWAINISGNAATSSSADKASADSAGNNFVSKYPYLFQETTSTSTYKISIKSPNGDTVQVKNTSGTLVNELTVPAASTSIAGLVSIGAQTWLGSKTISASGDAGVYAETSASGKANKIGFINGSSSGYSGLYSSKHSKWVAYIDLSGNSYFKGTADLTDAVNGTPAIGDDEFTRVWFSYGPSSNTTNEKKRAYDDAYKYNSGTHTLNVTQYRINDHGLISYDANTESIVFSFV